MQSKIQLQGELDTQNVVYPQSYYKNYALNSIGPSFTELTANTNPMLTYELPADSIINFNKIQLSFSTNQITDDFTATNQYLGIPVNYMPFLNRIEVYTGAGNLKLLDLNNCDIYSKISSHLMNDFTKNLQSSGVMYPKNQNADFVPNSGTSKKNIVCYQNYLLSSMSTTVGQTNTPSILSAQKFNYRIGDFLGDTIFNLNKSIYIAKSIFIRLTFNNTKRIVQKFSDQGSPSAMSDKTIGISNIALKIYTENDPLIIEQVKNQSRQGVSYIMPDIVSNVYNLVGEGTKGIQFKISNLTGNNDSRLYKCYSVLNSTAGTGTSYCILPTSNYNNGKYKYISLFVNSQNILNLDCDAKDDLNHLLSQHLNHSLCDEYGLNDNGVICNVFDTNPCKNIYDNDELKGLIFSQSGDITINWQYTISPAANNQISGNANYENYQYGIVLRKLFSRNGELSMTNF